MTSVGPGSVMNVFFFGSESTAYPARFRPKPQMGMSVCWGSAPAPNGLMTPSTATRLHVSVPVLSLVLLRSQHPGARSLRLLRPDGTGLWGAAATLLTRLGSKVELDTEAPVVSRVK